VVVQGTIPLNSVTQRAMILVSKAGRVEGDDEIDFPFCDVAFEDALDQGFIPFF
jgi:hypothetical protein